MIEILDVRLLARDKPLKAFADVQVDDWTIRVFRIVQHNGGKAYVETPMRSWRDSSGVVQFQNILTLPKDLKWQIESAILAEYQRAKEEKGDDT